MPWYNGVGVISGQGKNKGQGKVREILSEWVVWWQPCKLDFL